MFRINISHPWQKGKDTWQFEFLPSMVTTATPPANLVGGALYEVTTRLEQINLYGGAVIAFDDKFNNLTKINSLADSVWEYDTKSRAWSTLSSTDQGLNVSRHSAHAQASEHHLTFYLDVEGLIVRNTSTGAVSHISGTSLPGGASRIGAGLQYIPDIGTKGILILIGGATVSDHWASTSTFGELVRKHIS